MLVVVLGGCKEKVEPPCQSDIDCTKSGERCRNGKCSGTTACIIDGDCAGGEICTAGICTDVNVVCTGDADCARGQQCNQLTGACIDIPPCTEDADCETGFLCRQSTGECVVDPGCSRDIDCGPPARVCEAGVCIDGCGSAGCVLPETCGPITGRCAVDQSCTTDGDCNGAQPVCQGGQCIDGCEISGCSPGAICNTTTHRCDGQPVCDTDADCGAPVSICYLSVCIDGCEPGLCGTGYVCGTTTGRCQPEGSGGCTSDAGCAPPSTVCQSGTCVSGCTAGSCGVGFLCNAATGRCEVDPGGGCTIDSDCTAPFTQCVSGECLPVGGDCTTNGCPVGQLCDPYLGACESQGTVALGAACTSHGDCASDYCLVLGGGVQVCTRVCGASHQCPLDFNCFEVPPAGTRFCIHEALIGKDYGSSGAGVACSAAVNTCQSGICYTPTGQCSDTCQNQSECERAVDTCYLLIGDFDGNLVEELLTLCLPGAFGQGQGQFCSVNDDCLRGNCLGGTSGNYCADPCCKSGDCPSGYTCQAVTRTNASGVIRACGQSGVTGIAPVGSPCSRVDHTPCRSAWCLEDPTGAPPYCTDTCCGAADCPSGFRCIAKLFDTNNDGVDDVSQPLCQRR